MFSATLVAGYRVLLQVEWSGPAWYHCAYNIVQGSTDVWLVWRTVSLMPALALKGGVAPTTVSNVTLLPNYYITIYKRSYKRVVFYCRYIVEQTRLHCGFDIMLYCSSGPNDIVNHILSWIWFFENIYSLWSLGFQVFLEWFLPFICNTCRSLDGWREREREREPVREKEGERKLWWAPFRPCNSKICVSMYSRKKY